MTADGQMTADGAKKEALRDVGKQPALLHEYAADLNFERHKNRIVKPSLRRRVVPQTAGIRLP